MTNHPNRSKQQQATHTPGPWIYRPQIAGQKGVVDCGTRIVCEMPYTTMINQPKVDTNASLIAAAPELLAALKLVRDEYCEGGMLDATPAEKAICAAIAKAEGR